MFCQCTRSMLNLDEIEIMIVACKTAEPAAAWILRGAQNSPVAQPHRQIAL